MTWEQICDDSNLRDLPYKIEQDRFGRIVMSPAKADHGRYQIRIGRLLEESLPGWAVYCECGVETHEGVKVPDVAGGLVDPEILLGFVLSGLNACVYASDFLGDLGVPARAIAIDPAYGRWVLTSSGPSVFAPATPPGSSVGNTQTLKALATASKVAYK